MFPMRHRVALAAAFTWAGVLALPAPSQAGPYRRTRSYAAATASTAGPSSSAAGQVQRTGSADTGIGWYESNSPKRQFQKKTGYPNGRPGYVVDYIVPLAKGGADSPQNMQWLTIEQARARVGAR